MLIFSENFNVITELKLYIWGPMYQEFGRVSECETENGRIVVKNPEMLNPSFNRITFRMTIANTVDYSMK